ncbi:hypothetical protein J1N35_021135 [Gossypium stocksii]|uniref:Uncharacterized protein n=1 Tax=Gossypium stocksii TaxID=47602 RepID=A0A9D3VF91_9ROSI|nr:hypothetical protein J1N35_021135 [Gossypium stocksii]
MTVTTTGPIIYSCKPSQRWRKISSEVITKVGKNGMADEEKRLETPVTREIFHGYGSWYAIPPILSIARKHKSNDDEDDDDADDISLF